MAMARIRRRTVAWSAGAILAGVTAVWAGHSAWAAFETSNAPSCSWPLQVHGKPTGAQAGLVRCYLQALARRDKAGLLTVAADIPPVHITQADLTHSADARSGQATATFLPATVDTMYIPVIISYADGASDRL